MSYVMGINITEIVCVCFSLYSFVYSICLCTAASVSVYALYALTSLPSSPSTSVQIFATSGNLSFISFAILSYSASDKSSFNFVCKNCVMLSMLADTSVSPWLNTFQDFDAACTALIVIYLSIFAFNCSSRLILRLLLLLGISEA